VNFAITAFYEVRKAPSRYPWVPLAEIGRLRVLSDRP
jgi:hypothetical protein